MSNSIKERPCGADDLPYTKHVAYDYPISTLNGFGLMVNNGFSEKILNDLRKAPWSAANPTLPEKTPVVIWSVDISYFVYKSIHISVI